jgi:hypothetical protein
MNRAWVVAAVAVAASCTPRTDSAPQPRAATVARRSASAAPPDGGSGTFFDTLLRSCLDRLRIPVGKATVDNSDAQAKERIEFLDRDFGTTAFARARRVWTATVLTADAAGDLHLGLVDLEFSTCAQVRDAQAAIGRSDRTNFRLPVLTAFAVVPNGRHIALVFSETSPRNDVSALLGDTAFFGREKRGCEDRP